MGVIMFIHKKNIQGFTLIELMIVIAIIGLLASLAMSSFSHYVIRTKVSEGLGIAFAAKMAVAEAVYFEGTLAQVNALNTIFSFSPSKYTLSVAVSNNGIIMIIPQNLGVADSPTLTLTPSQIYSGAPILWQCTTLPVTAFAYVPLECRN
jgi:type IV pilus assembly protein PilA